jgi:anti-sigma-K factor RskA
MSDTNGHIERRASDDVHDDLHDMAALYAVDALVGDETARFETHLRACASCRREVDEFRAVAGQLASSVAEPPPDALKASVLSRVAETPQESGDLENEEAHVGPVVIEMLPESRRARRWITPIAVAAVLIAIVSVGAVVVNLRSDDVTMSDVQSSDDLVVATLDGSDADIVVSWSPDLGRVVVEGEDVAGVADDEVYELWAIVGETPVPAGLIPHEGGGVSAMFEFDIDDVSAWGITVEPEGGSDVPTPPILYFAEV